jgi:flagellar hook protein FlgE
MTVNLDFKNMTMLSTTGSSDVAMTYQDGVMAGRVSDISIENTTGKISLLFSNGMRQPLGQLALANFNNVSGLLRQGHTTFIPSENSGGPNIGAAGSSGRGAITAGYLESSNVDMANEFTNMILAQRGFQAQTRMITTSDEILQELVNLKR